MIITIKRNSDKQGDIKVLLPKGAINSHKTSAILKSLLARTRNHDAALKKVVA
jgi:uncharacterized protein YhaN